MGSFFCKILVGFKMKIKGVKELKNKNNIFK